MFKTYVTTTIGALCVAGSTSAAGVLYDCKIDNPDRAKGWISPTIAIVLPGDDTVKIVDVITLTFVKAPVSGTVLRDNTQRLIVKWTVEGIKADDGISFAGVNYRASIGKSNGAVEVQTIPNGYDRGLRASGRCTTRTP